MTSNTLRPCFIGGERFIPMVVPPDEFEELGGYVKEDWKLAQWACTKDLNDGVIQGVKDTLFYFYKCAGLIRGISEIQESLSALTKQELVPKWRGKMLFNVSSEDNKITLSSIDNRESFTFNTAIDDFYAIGDYVVINRRECDEEPRPEQPDGRTIVLGKQKFQEILKEAGGLKVTLDKSYEDNFTCDTPKKVIDLIGPKIFKERGFLLVNALDLEIEMYDETNCNDGCWGGCDVFDSVNESLIQRILNMATPDVVLRRDEVLKRTENSCIVKHTLHCDGSDTTCLFCQEAYGRSLPETQWGELKGQSDTDPPNVYKEFTDDSFKPDVSVKLQKGDLLYFQNCQYIEGCEKTVRGVHRVNEGYPYTRILRIFLGDYQASCEK